MSRAPATRMGLLEVRARRAVATRGARLLRAKREVLAGELWRLAREVEAGRARLDEALGRAALALGYARAFEGEPLLASLAGPAARPVEVRVTPRRVWGVATPELAAPPLTRPADARGTSPTSWSPTAAEAARLHEAAVEVLLGIATRELHLARLADEVRETSRRINALEEVVLPALAADASRIGSALAERDREDAVRRRRMHPT